jgi:hypothetical protein
MKNRTTLDQIFGNINSRGILKTSLNSLDMLNVHARNIIEKAFKHEYKVVYDDGYSRKIIFSSQDLLLMSSEIEDTSIESIAEIAKIPFVMTGFFCFGDALAMLRKLNDAIPLGLIHRKDICRRMVFDGVDKEDSDQLEDAKRKLYLFSDFIHKEKLFNLLTISQLFRYREFEEIKSRIDTYIPVMNTTNSVAITEYDLDLMEILMDVDINNPQEAVRLFNGIDTDAFIDTITTYKDDEDVVESVLFRLKINNNYIKDINFKS